MGRSAAGMKRGIAAVMSRTTHGDVRIGTSGWHYASWRGSFYPASTRPAEMLAAYAREFDAVEINNSFYKLPDEATLRAWRAQTPPGFCFAAKGSRFLTHMKKLRDPQGALDNFLPRVEALGPRLGPVLWQLPPRWGCNAQRLEDFLRVLPARHRYAFEFRDPSWHAPEVYRVLERYGAAFCVFDLGGFQSPVVQTADLVYVRLHGPAQKYTGSYDGRALAAWARRVEKWSGAGAEVHVYFDNDQGAAAPHDARALRAKLGLVRAA